MDGPEVTSMREGRGVTDEVPPWLRPYAVEHDVARNMLTTPEKVLFDQLWDRACGKVPPALSGRERAKLISFLKPTTGGTE